MLGKNAWMRRRPDEASRRLTARMQELPPEQRGELMLGLWGYAVTVSAVNAAAAIALGRVGWRVARCGSHRPIPMVKAAWSPALGVAAGLLSVEHLSHPIVRRTLESWVDTRTSGSGTS